MSDGHPTFQSADSMVDSEPYSGEMSDESLTNSVLSCVYFHCGMSTLFTYSFFVIIMNPEQLVQWILGLSPVFQLTIVGLTLAGIQQLKQGYIGRIAIAGMAILILQQTYPVWDTLAPVWRYYAIGGVVWGGIGVVTYLTDTSLPTEYYKIAFVVYGAIPVGIILLFGF